MVGYVPELNVNKCVDAIRLDYIAREVPSPRVHHFPVYLNKTRKDQSVKVNVKKTILLIISLVFISFVFTILTAGVTPEIKTQIALQQMHDGAVAPATLRTWSSFNILSVIGYLFPTVLAFYIFWPISFKKEE